MYHRLSEKAECMIAILKALSSFVIVFILSFVLAGWFLMPYLPPVPTTPVSVFELDYWITNWVGALIGIILGTLSAVAIMRRPTEG